MTENRTDTAVALRNALYRLGNGSSGQAVQEAIDARIDARIAKSEGRCPLAGCLASQIMRAAKKLVASWERRADE